jgi:hypothetical protein
MKIPLNVRWTIIHRFNEALRSPQMEILFIKKFTIKHKSGPLPSQMFSKEFIHEYSGPDEIGIDFCHFRKGLAVVVHDVECRWREG